MEHAVAQHHSRVNLDQCFHQRAWLHCADRDARVERVDSCALEVLQHQDVATREFRHDFGDPQSSFVREALAHARALCSLTHEVHLFAHVDGELVEYDAESQHMMVRESRIHPVNDATGDAHVTRNQRLDTRSENLDDDLAAEMPGPMHLSQ